MLIVDYTMCFCFIFYRKLSEPSQQKINNWMDSLWECNLARGIR